MEGRIQEIKQSYADALWGERDKWVKKALITLSPNIDELVESVLNSVSDLEDNTQLKQELVEEFTEFVRRGLNRAFKRTRKEYGE